MYEPGNSVSFCITNSSLLHVLQRYPLGKLLNSNALGFARHRAGHRVRGKEAVLPGFCCRSAHCQEHKEFFFLIVSNLSTEALFNVLSLFEMWNLSATISIQMQGGHKTYLVQRITEL